MQEGLTGLVIATQHGHKDVVQSLVEKKANLDITDKVSLCFRVWIMYHCSLCVQTAGRSALFFAAQEGNVKIAKILVGGGADVDLKDKVDWYSYEYYGHTESSLLPLIYTPLSQTGLTALDTAKLNNQKDVCKLLEKHSHRGAREDITEVRAGWCEYQHLSA